jgi:endonuclease III
MKKQSTVDIDSIYKRLSAEVQTYEDLPIVDLIQVQTRDPFKVLVATILSARTQDRTTAAACRRLFARVETLEQLGRMRESTIEKLIYPVGFYRAKAQHLKKLPAVVRQRFNNTIPQTIDELVELPGVGRKTANLVRAIAFDKPAICVDVHVHRISNRLGYVRTKTPYDTEMALRKKLPSHYWKGINSILVAFGQHHCRPVSPKCESCVIYDNCRRIGVKKR